MTLKRVSIMIEIAVEKKLRNIQAKTILATHQSYSFSACMNDELKKVLK